MANNNAANYSEGTDKLSRIDALQTQINLCNYNLLGKNDIGKYNYEIKVNALNTLLAEVSSYITKDESKLTEKIREIFQYLFKFKKVNSTIIDGTGKKVNFFNSSNWETLEKFLSIYEREIKSLINKYFGGNEPGIQESKQA